GAGDRRDLARQRYACRQLGGAGELSANGTARHSHPHRRGCAARRPGCQALGGAMTDTAERPQAASAGATRAVALPFDEIAARLRVLELPDVDVVYGVATGGIVPASLVAYQLGKPLELIRSEEHTSELQSRENLV